MIALRAKPPRFPRRHRILAAIASALALASIIVALVSSGSRSPSRAAAAAAPSASAATSAAPVSVASSAGASSVAPEPSPTPRRISATGDVPIHITIPSIKVSADMLELGINADKTVQVPSLSDVGLAGWYKYSPAPGVVGPSVILGHIDSARYGRGVFYDLGKVKKGDLVEVQRADHLTATFTVSDVAEYPKTSFPTAKIYGNTAGSTVRLITCGGKLDRAGTSYLDNIVVYGTLKSLQST